MRTVVAACIFICCVNEAIANESVRFSNVLDVLTQEKGWDKKLIGPTGQSYTINLDPSGQAVLELHPIIQQQYNDRVSTPICSIFSTGRSIRFSSDVFVDYDDERAIEARKKYLFNGEAAMSAADWLLVDKRGWLTHVTEGFEGHQNCSDYDSCRWVARKYFDKVFTVQNCDTHQTTLKINNETFVFPNLILTLPEFVFLSSDSVAQTTNATLNLGDAINENNRTLFDLTIGNIMGRVEACLLTATEQANSQAMANWHGAKDYFFDAFEPYYLLASVMSQMVETSYPGSVDLTTLQREPRSSDKYQQRFEEMYQDPDCLNFGDDSMYASLGSFVG